MVNCLSDPILLFTDLQYVLCIGYFDTCNFFYKIPFNSFSRFLTAQINTIGLVRKSNVNTKGWVYKAIEATALLWQLGQRLYIRIIERNELPVLIDSRRRNRFCQHRRVACKVVAEQDCPGTNLMLLRYLQNCLILKQWRSCAAQWAICCNVDPFFFAEIYDFLLRQERVVFDLIGGGNDGCLREQLLKVLDGVVGDTNSFYLFGVRLDQFLQVLPCINVSYAVINVARAIWELGEERVVT
jgi:hypothetical protein